MSYDASWHARLGDKTDSSAEKILAFIWDLAEFDSVLDVGCGDGRWLRQAQALGATSIQGIDGPWTDKRALVIPEECFVVRDLSRRFNLHKRFDLVMSQEVAEHVSGEHSALFVDNLVAHGDCILFGAAIPYQSGYRHINEKWQSYWADLFDQRGYQVFDLFRSHVWQTHLVHYWYKQNSLLYINRDRSDLMKGSLEFINKHKVASLPVDIVHPEKYLAIASYNEIAFKPLLKKLSAKMLKKARVILLGKT